VRWDDMAAFCTWAGGRLPSEAEWEYAARSVGRPWTYPWGNEEATCAYAIMSNAVREAGCREARTWPVCSRTDGNSRQSLCDMAGNVSEWVQDWYHKRYHEAPTDGSAWDEADSFQVRVHRGGGFVNTADSMRATNRQALSPSLRKVHIGARCARDRKPLANSPEDAGVPTGSDADVPDGD
jgi:formylglycine-generating enzyme required for sulfatase activity